MPQFRPTLTPLDDRLVPDIGVSAGVLAVRGTEQADVIVIEREAGSLDDYFVTIYDRATRRTRPGEPRREYDEQDFASVRVDGLGGNDVIVNWTNYRATLDGGRDDDTLQGGFSDDTLAGGGGSDTYLFWATPAAPPLVPVPVTDEFPNPLRTLGVDTVREADDADADAADFRNLGGGAFFDAAQTTPIQVAVGRLFVQLESAPGVPSGAGVENLTGTPSRDYLWGNARPNVLDAGGGNDVLAGRGGDDVLQGGEGGDTYRFEGGAQGTDTLVEVAVHPGADRLDLSAAPGPVTLDLASAAVQTVAPNFLRLQLSGLIGSAAAAVEDVTGSAYADALRGNALANTLAGNGGADVLEGRAGDDVLYGDGLPAAPGGAAGNDTFVFAGGGNLGTDRVVERAGQGVDRLDFSGLAAGVRVDLRTTAGQTAAVGLLGLQLDAGGAAGESQVENVTGTGFRDVLTGNGLSNQLLGLGGHDDLFGGRGVDALFGGAGNDLLSGEEDNDFLFGNEWFSLPDVDTYLGGAGVDTNFRWLPNGPQPIQIVWTD